MNDKKRTLSKLSIRDLALKGKRLFMRVDFNVPIQDGKVVDDTRIQAALPSIELALKKNAKLILASHLGRPKGVRKSEFSLRPVSEHLSELLGQDVLFAGDCIGEPARSVISVMIPGSLVLLENVRFHKGETDNDPDFASDLARLADAYVNDAFGTAHRAHASTVGVPTILGRAAAGLLMEKELEYLSKVLYDPEHPVVAILGGAKISDKIPVIENLLNLADTILIGGGMAYTFLKSQGRTIGKSIVEEEKVGFCGDMIERARKRGVDLVLPVDHVVASKLEAGAEHGTTSGADIPGEMIGVDIGPSTVDLFREKLSGARTVIWNGPMGVFEIDEFSQGTVALAQAVSETGGLSIVGGGDSVSAVKKAGVADRMSHISTGGGASLEFLSGEELPGVSILTDWP